MPGSCPDDTVVATVMSNIGFERAMTEHGIHLVRRGSAIATCSRRWTGGGFVLGGEQSGHVIFRRYATTGDGLLTAVRFLSLAAATGATVGELAGVMRRYPQAMSTSAWSIATGGSSPAVASAVATAADALGDGGRVLLRPSGTEPLVRVMVEAASEADARAHAEAIAAVVGALA